MVPAATGSRMAGEAPSGQRLETAHRRRTQRREVNGAIGEIRTAVFDPADRHLALMHEADGDSQIAADDEPINAQRPLSDEGRATARKMADHFAAAGDQDHRSPFGRGLRRIDQ